MKQQREHQLLPLTVESYSSDGEGVARLPDGMTCFVKGALRGETCRVRLLKVGKRCAWGECVEVLSPSPARVTPDCPHFGRCGGCSLRHMTYQEELAFKRQKVQDALRRIGGTDLPVSAIFGAQNTLRYRNKVQFPVAPGPDGPKVGFFQAKSHAVVDVPDCLLQPEPAAALADALRQWMVRYGVPAYDERAHQGLIRHLFLRFAQSGILCCVVANGERLPHEAELVERLRAAAPALTGVVLSVNQARTNVVLGPVLRTLWGQDTLEDTLCGRTFRLSVPSFYQVNRAQCEVLYGKAAELAGLTGAETVLDLYCGAGTITLTLAGQARQAIGAEIVPSAIANAKENAVRNGVTNARFFLGDAGAVAARLSGEGLHAHVVVVDPPRKGLAEEVPGIIASLGPERVVYVSCDPATLARDVKRFAAQGYFPRTALAVDLFPRTPHVETVVQLSKGEIDSRKVRVEFSLEDMDMSEFQKGATYSEIKAYVLEQFGLKVSNLYISQVKRKCGLEVGPNYNLPKSEGQRVPQCPLEKEEAILEALKHFRMI